MSTVHRKCDRCGEVRPVQDGQVAYTEAASTTNSARCDLCAKCRRWLRALIRSLRGEKTTRPITGYTTQQLEKRDAAGFVKRRLGDSDPF